MISIVSNNCVNSIVFILKSSFIKLTGTAVGRGESFRLCNRLRSLVGEILHTADECEHKKLIFFLSKIILPLSNELLGVTTDFVNLGR